jgi:hypothetical protein
MDKVGSDSERREPIVSGFFCSDRRTFRLKLMPGGWRIRLESLRLHGLRSSAAGGNTMNARYFLVRARPKARTVVALAVGALLLSNASASATVVPTYSPGSTFSGTHDPGTPGGGSPFTSSIAIGSGTASLTAPFAPHNTLFSGGSTKANAGMAHVQTTTLAKATFASGTGVDQSDPNHVQSASSLQLNFHFIWDIIGGTFGPPISGSFSVPVGVKTGSQGSASFQCDVHWDVIKDGVVTFDARAPYSASMSWGANVNSLTNFTAPAGAFSPSSIPDNQGTTDQIIFRGFVKFVVNNDIDPALIEIPTDVTTYQLDPGQQFSDFQYEPFGSFDTDKVPEPSSALLLTGMFGMLLRRRVAGRR